MKNTEKREHWHVKYKIWHYGIYSKKPFRYPFNVQSGHNIEYKISYIFLKEVLQYQILRNLMGIWEKFIHNRLEH